MQRRQFHQLLTSGTIAGLCPRSLANHESEVDRRWPVAIFEKPLEGLSFSAAAQAVADSGADGIEATIRPGGHVSPDRAADDVPRFAEALSRHDLRILIAATAISQANEAARELLQTLRNAGIRHYRMAHFRYDLTRPLHQQLEEFRARAEDIAAMNADLGLQGLYQNHSGGSRKRAYVGALGWDTAEMLQDVNPDHLGAAIDTRHLRKDTGSHWQLAARLLKPFRRSIYLKDGRWSGDRNEAYADVPLDTGFVDESVFREVFLPAAPMPICIHMEWLGYRVFPDNEIPDAVNAFRRDVTTARRWIARASSP